MRNRGLVAAAAFIAATGTVAVAENPKLVMFGNTPSRNMVSSETDLPAEWDL